MKIWTVAQQLQVVQRILSVGQRLQLVPAQVRAMARVAMLGKAAAMARVPVRAATAAVPSPMSSAAFAAGKPDKSADGLGCSFSVAKNASPAARCAAIRKQCGGNHLAIRPQCQLRLC